MTKDTMRTWAEINLGAVRHNVKAMRAAFPEGTKYLAVVKTNAYGHGAVPVAHAALEAGAAYLAVACLPEAEELRSAGIDAPILILGVTPPEFAERARELGVTQAVGSLDYARALSEALGGALRVHMKLDTGMSRTGFDAVRPERFDDIAEALALPRLEYEGVFTHFAVSDVCGDGFTAAQFERFTRTVERAETMLGRRFSLRHCANSGAVVNYKEFAMDMVRPGIMLYGCYPGPERGGIDLRPVMALKSRVFAITEHFPGDTVSYGRTFQADKPMRLAVVPIGYGDGLHRLLSGKIDVLIRGRRCRQVGRICMDMCMVDVSGLPECAEGDVVTIFGRDGDAEIRVDELAEKAGTISYELLCAVAPRVPRIYL